MKYLVGITYAKDSGIIGHLRRFVLLGRSWRLNSEILYIAASEDDIIVDLICRGDLLVRVASPAFGAIGSDILEGDRRLLGVDLVQDTGVPIVQSQSSCRNEQVSLRGENRIRDY